MAAFASVINQVVTPQYAIYHGDCVEVLRGVPSDSLHMSVFSPPFGSLYSYTEALQDMSNVRTDSEFYEGMDFMVSELYRAMMPGRLVSFHCMNLPSTIERDGFIGIKDFRGDLIRQFQRHGFIYHSEVVIWKDPLIAATRTHALGLAHKQVVQDSSLSRNGIPDYLVTMRKPGKNPEPISHAPGRIRPLDRTSRTGAKAGEEKGARQEQVLPRSLAAVRLPSVVRYRPLRYAAANKRARRRGLSAHLPASAHRHPARRGVVEQSRRHNPLSLCRNWKRGVRRTRRRAPLRRN